MEGSFSKYIVIGAGLSGLTSAYLLHRSGEKRIRVLESRKRIGGRINTESGIDFGATWFQTHHRYVIGLLEELELDKFHQYSQGKSVLVYNSMAPAHYFENDPHVQPAYRVAGGTSAIIAALAAPVKEIIQTQTTVTEIIENHEGVTVRTDNGVYHAEKAIITIPPRIATRISFDPALPASLSKVMHRTHTWMSNAMKIGLQYDQPFWRKKGFSGTMIGQIGAVTELYDHSNYEDNVYSLMGFINEGMRELTAEKRKSRIIDHIAKYLGEEARNYTHYQEKDWYSDKHTSCNQLNSVYISPEYGKPEFQRSYMNDKLMFSGAETAPQHGGYMDGAILQGITSANWLLGTKPAD